MRVDDVSKNCNAVLPVVDDDEDDDFELFFRAEANPSKTGDHGPSIALSMSVSQHGNDRSNLSNGSLDCVGMNGADDRRHLQTITSPDDETMIDSVRDMAKEQYC